MSEAASDESTAVVERGEYLIWSNEHRRWWGPDEWGYVARIDQAGRYPRERALEICTKAMLGREGDAPLPEIPVPLADAQLMRQRFVGRYPRYDPEPK